MSHFKDVTIASISFPKAKWRRISDIAAETLKNVQIVTKCSTSTSRINMSNNTIRKFLVRTAANLSRQPSLRYMKRTALRNQFIANIAT